MSSTVYESEFKRDGFVVVQSFLPPDELADLQANIARYIREVVPGLPPTDVFYQDRQQSDAVRQLHRMEQDAYFESYLNNTRWIAFASSLLGEEVKADAAEWFNKLSGGHPTPPHQDNQYFLLTPPHVVTMWLALDVVDEDNGALRYVRGSHLLGPRRHAATETVGFSQGIVDYGPDDEQAECVVCLRPGDLVAHHGETIHRADANRSAHRQRRAFAMVFSSVLCQKDQRARLEYESDLSAQQSQHGISSAKI
jgi:phytanoyl-CoA hydroxylase